LAVFLANVEGANKILENRSGKVADSSGLAGFSFDLVDIIGLKRIDICLSNLMCLVDVLR